MARKQTRRCVSLNGTNYEALKQEAGRRGMTVAGLVELALSALGVPMIAHPQQAPELARTNAARRAERVEARRGRVVAEEPPAPERPLIGESDAETPSFQ